MEEVKGECWLCGITFVGSYNKRFCCYAHADIYNNKKSSIRKKIKEKYAEKIWKENEDKIKEKVKKEMEKFIEEYRKGDNNELSFIR